MLLAIMHRHVKCMERRLLRYSFQGGQAAASSLSSRRDNIFNSLANVWSHSELHTKQGQWWRRVARQVAACLAARQNNNNNNTQHHNAALTTNGGDKQQVHEEDADESRLFI